MRTGTAETAWLCRYMTGCGRNNGSIGCYFQPMTTFFLLTQGVLLLPLLIGALWFRRPPKHWLDCRGFGFALLASSFFYVQATVQFWLWGDDFGLAWLFYVPTVIFAAGLALVVVPQPKDPVRSRRTYGLVAIGLGILYLMAALLMPPVRQHVGLIAAVLGITLLPDAILVAKHGETPFFVSLSRIRSMLRVAYYGCVGAASLYCLIEFVSVGDSFLHIESLLRLETVASANPGQSAARLEWCHWEILKYAMAAAVPALIPWCVYMASQGLEFLKSPQGLQQPKAF